MPTFVKRIFSLFNQVHLSFDAKSSITLSPEHTHQLQQIAKLRHPNANSCTLNTLVEEAINFYITHVMSDGSSMSNPLPTQESAKPSLDYPWCAADDYLVWKSTEPKKKTR